MLSGDDLHGFCPPLELLVQSLDDVGRPKRYPFFFREREEGETGIERVLEAFDCGGKNRVPLLVKLPGKGLGLRTRRSIEDGPL